MLRISVSAADAVMLVTLPWQEVVWRSVVERWRQIGGGRLRGEDASEAD